MRVIKKLTDLKFLNLKQVTDKDNNVKGYFFAERLGVDSIAFICYDPHTQEYLLNHEYKPPIGEFILGAFGGSLDNKKDKIDIVIDEVREEAGFHVNRRDVSALGKVFVSTQMNQFCHLYLVKVNSKDEKEREPQNAVEAMAETKWVGEKEIAQLQDWKAMAIVLTAIAKHIL